MFVEPGIAAHTKCLGAYAKRNIIKLLDEKVQENLSEPEISSCA